MHYNICPPSLDLSFGINAFWSMEQEHVGTAEHLHLVPDGFVEWVFVLEGSMKITTQDSPFVEQMPSCFAFGQLSRYIKVEFSENARLFAIKFHPVLAKTFWNLPMHLSLDSFFDLHSLNVPHTEELRCQLQACSDHQEKVACAEKWMRKRFSDPLNTIGEQRFNIQYFDSRLSSYSSRRQQQIYKSEVGISKSRLRKILRLNVCLAALPFLENQSLTTFALDHGYFDQAHFNRDIKEFTGHSPSSFLKNISPSKDLLNLWAL